jgi:hypothetical protein
MSTETDKIQALADEIDKNRKQGRVTHSVLQTSQRVLKRITDGIYRQPSSALRELISNGYDADAKQVSIDLDAPSFEKLTITDDGNGLTTKALASLIRSIGGSSKRTHRGVELGVGDPDDPTRSPGGRKLIGKIGIGIFSVAQLTREFQIITKVKGEKYRTMADIILETHSEDALQAPYADKEAVFKTGNVKIWTVPAEDTSTHGTQIILRNLLPKTRDELASRDLWARIHHTDLDFSETDTPAPVPPPYHIGYTDPQNPNILLSDSRLPWSPKDNPVRRFEKLVQSVYDHLGMTRNPSRLEIFDNYLNTIWTLSLCAPLEYIDGHPFGIRGQDGIPVYLLANPKTKGRAERIDLAESETIRQRLKLISPETQRGDVFEVIVDGMSLRRPLRFRDLPETDTRHKQPLIFIGRDEPDFSKIPESMRGGNLAFEAYFFWTPKVVPTEHRGVLLRINNASGAMFDETFLKYQVSEQNRLRRITAEIFVTNGLDAALNIDRESFNVAHPHYQYITLWVHNALRLIATRQKALAKELRETDKAEAAVRYDGEFEKLVHNILHDLYSDDEDIPVVSMLDSEDEARTRRRNESGAIILLKNRIFERLARPERSSAGTREREKHLERVVVAIAKLLNGYEIFEKLDYRRQQEILRDIATIIAFRAEE